MPVLRSHLDTASESYRANRAAMQEKLARLEALLDQARAGGGERYVARHRARGKLLVRERIEGLLDPDSPFLELSPIAGATTEYRVGASLGSQELISRATGRELSAAPWLRYAEAKYLEEAE